MMTCVKKNQKNFCCSYLSLLSKNTNNIDGILLVKGKKHFSKLGK